jgi:SET and MYND domain-containing protein
MLLVQKEEWKLHQLECRVMAALTEDREKMLTPTIRLMVRLVLKRKLQNEKVLAGSMLTLFIDRS